MTKRFALTRILVVDPEKAHHELMGNYLKQLGVIHYMTASNGDDALSLLLKSENNFHAVFTDYDMPQMDGLELVSACREYVQLKHIKLAMISDNFSAQEPHSDKEFALRSFLTRKGVLQIPKEGLDASMLARALKDMTGL